MFEAHGLKWDIDNSDWQNNDAANEAADELESRVHEWPPNLAYRIHCFLSDTPDRVRAFLDRNILDAQFEYDVMYSAQIAARAVVTSHWLSQPLSGHNLQLIAVKE